MNEIVFAMVFVGMFLAGTVIISSPKPIDRFTVKISLLLFWIGLTNALLLIIGLVL